MYDREETVMQKWTYSASDRSLLTQLNPKLAVDNSSAPGAIVWAYLKNGSVGQSWRFESVTPIRYDNILFIELLIDRGIFDCFHHSAAMPDPNTWYYVQSDLGMVLEVRGGLKGSDVPISTNTKNGSDAQKWKFLADGRIQNALGSYLEVQGGAVRPQTALTTNSQNENAAQKWSYNLSDRSLLIQSSPNLAVDIQSSNGSAGATVWTLIMLMIRY